MDSSKNKYKKSINEIRTNLERQFSNTILYLYNFELDSLDQFLVAPKEENLNLLLYVPIRLVTIIECYYREIIKSLVNYDDLYANKLIKYIKDNVHIDMDFINSLVGKKITVGDIVSQIVSVKRLDSFISIMEDLLGAKTFKPELTKFLKEQEPETPSLDFILGSLSELNSYRNIIVHEYSKLEIGEDKIQAYVKHTRIFLMAIENLVNKIQGIKQHETQMEMNIDSFNEAKEWNVKIRSFVNEIIKYLLDSDCKSNIRQLVKFYNLREKSCLEYAKFKAEFFKDGSIYPLILNSALSEARIHFLEELKNVFTDINDKIDIYPVGL